VARTTFLPILVFLQLFFVETLVLVVTIWSFARLIAVVVTIILSSNEIQNGDVLVPANPDPSGK